MSRIILQAKFASNYGHKEDMGDYGFDLEEGQKKDPA